MKAYAIKCAGRVQGVYFRASTKEKADTLGLTGWVKNMPDGCSVLIHAEGDERKLNELIDWCYLGPPMAKVSSVEVEIAVPEAFGSFEIRRS